MAPSNQKEYSLPFLVQMIMYLFNLIKQVNSEIGGLFGVSKADFDFSRDNHIDTIIINSMFGLNLASISGSRISTILISGENVSIDDLCMFTSKNKLPKLSLVRIQRATIIEFGQHQFCRMCESSQHESPESEKPSERPSSIEVTDTILKHFGK